MRIFLSLFAIVLLGCSEDETVAGSTGAGASSSSVAASTSSSGGGGVCPEPFAVLRELDAAEMTADATHAYLRFDDVAGLKRIVAVSLEGGEQVVVAEHEEIGAIAADATGLYYTASDGGLPFELRRLTAVGGADELVSQLASIISSVALDATNVYFAAWFDGSEQAAVYRVPKRSTDAVPILVADSGGYGQPLGLSVGATGAIWQGGPSMPSGNDARICSAAIPGPSQIMFVGRAGGMTMSLAAGGDRGFATVQPGNGTTELWSFALGATTPDVRVGYYESLIADAQHLYWIGDGGIRRASLDLSEEALFTGCVEGVSLAQNETAVVVAVRGGDPDALRLYEFPK